MRYLIKFSYDGVPFYGFQRQNNLKTVQGTIEDALTSLNEKEVTIQASGRTDKGVHAKMQYAHFDLDKDVKPYNLKKYLNKSFDGEIFVEEVKQVENSFHSRYNVKEKTYCYYINESTFNPINRNYIYQLGKELDIDLMKKAANYLIGKHNFKAFATESKDKENTERTINSITFERENNILKITFNGDGFLRKMIRNIVGILIEIGLHKKEDTYIKQILDSEQRTGNLKCAPACGLYLEEIKFN